MVLQGFGMPIDRATDGRFGGQVLSFALDLIWHGPCFLLGYAPKKQALLR
jgi:hypothetical protein